MLFCHIPQGHNQTSFNHGFNHVIYIILDHNFLIRLSTDTHLEHNRIENEIAP